MNPGNRFSRSKYMLQLFSALVITSMVTVVAMSASSIVDRYAQPGVVLTGIVSDTMCGRTHGTSTLGNAECTRECVELGAEYALVVGKKIYVLQGHRAELDRFAGETVYVTGKVRSRDTVAVESITPLPVQVLRRI